MVSTQLYKNKYSIGIGIFVLMLLLFAIFKLAGGVLVFSYLKPTFLPAGISLRAVRVIATKDEVMVNQNFRDSDWVYSIDEYNYKSVFLPPAMGNYDPKSVSYTCSIFTSPKGKQFNLCHSVDYGTIGQFTVSHVNGKTLVVSHIPTEIGRVISTEEIGKYVDSFKRTPHLFAPTFRNSGP